MVTRMLDLSNVTARHVTFEWERFRLYLNWMLKVFNLKRESCNAMQTRIENRKRREKKHTQTNNQSRKFVNKNSFYVWLLFFFKGLSLFFLNYVLFKTNKTV